MGDCGADSEPSNLLQHSIQEIGSRGGRGCSDDRAMTAYGKCCKSIEHCMASAGEVYQTCATDDNPTISDSIQDYCTRSDKTSRGWYCRGDCAHHGEDYRWCRPTNNKWDYCVPEAMKAYKKRDEDLFKPLHLECRKWDTRGWHGGFYHASYLPTEAPDGKAWTWGQCAERCGVESFCEFWTLQLSDDKLCMMMADKGDFHADKNVIEGPKTIYCEAPEKE